MSNIITLDKHDEVFLHVKCELGTSMELKEFFSCYAPNYFFHPKFKAHLWNGKISYYDMKTKTFPIGLLPNFYSFLKKFRYKVKYNFDKSELANSLEEDNLKKFYDILFEKVKNKFFPRDYQHEAIFRGIKNKRGVVESPTASGKCSHGSTEIEVEVPDAIYKKILENRLKTKLKV